MSEKVWYKVAQNIVKTGEIPFPINKPMIDLMKELINEDQLDFLSFFKKSSYTYEEFKAQTNFEDSYINKKLNELMNIGMITGIPSRNSGIMVYRLSTFLPGLLEFTLMRGETGEKQKRLAKIWERFFNDLNKSVQKNYDQIMQMYKKVPPFDRVVPVEQEIEVQQEIVYPFEDVKKIVENFDTIGLSFCYCRHLKELLDEPCKLNAHKQNCFTFGRTAQFCVEHGFTKQISKEEALKILKEAEDSGLVHKAIHNHQNPKLEEIGLCNCCKCCCGSFLNFYRGTAPITTLTSYLAKVHGESCVGCGTCINICPMEAIDIEDTIAIINNNKCIGCGLCAYHCPERAAKLERTNIRSVFVFPPKLKSN